jgi:hypothetical protein
MKGVRVSGEHPVYPGGPDCNPHCPGPWSEYHDGYGDGYERAEREARQQGVRVSGEPTTGAGKAILSLGLVENLTGNGDNESLPDRLRRLVVDVENEARQQGAREERERLRSKLAETLPGPTSGGGTDWDSEVRLTLRTFREAIVSGATDLLSEPCSQCGKPASIARSVGGFTFALCAECDQKVDALSEPSAKEASEA